jgi:thiol:disulfide interchange protein DsbD
MDMQKNWHTYWKNPGDSGGPIKVQWKTSDNIEIGNIKWPSPELIPYEPLMTYGYTDFVIFPFDYKKIDENDSSIEVNVDFLICDDICVPEKAYIKTTLDQIKEDSLLIEWDKYVPNVVLPVLAKLNNEFIEIRFSNNNVINDINFFIENTNTVNHSQEQILIKEENNWLLKVPLNDSYEEIKKIKGVLSVNNSDVYLVDAEIEKSTSNSISLIQAILFAFIGGLILNLMPCVFPIISLKILSFVSLGNESTQKIRMHALTFCLGVLLSFILIGVLLIALKQTGNYLGWGFQLQSPVIVGFLCILMFIIGVILLTDIDIGSSFSRLGQYGSNSISGSFLTGVLAVVVASPCTAPFMGAALGYALIQPSSVTLPIFISLGMGFAAPYFALSLSPGLVNKLPKPGQWMVTLKEFFAFPMFATALWLLWVFSLQTNIDLLIGLLISILFISMLFWILNRVNKRIYKTIILFLLICVIVFVMQKILSFENDLSEEGNVSNLYSDSVKWDNEIERNYREKGQPYLVNFTAAWCITCQANDKIALSRPKVKEYFNNNNVEYIVADWTNKDDEILQTLESYNRSGVPLYIYWKPGMKEPAILPSILTEQILLDSF